MVGGSVTTGVDALLELLRNKKGKVAVSDLAKDLKLGEEVVKLWVEFLVEEKVIGIEYKFTKPYVYLNQPKKQAPKVIAQEQMSIETFKKAFEDRAQQSNIPQEQTTYLWKDHLINQLELEKPFFFREARKRGLEDIETLWEQYKTTLTG